MATYSVDPNIRNKQSLFTWEKSKIISVESVNKPTLTNSSIKNVANIISKKSELISKSELDNLGINIKLVGYNILDGLVSVSNKTFSPKLLNWIEKYEINGYSKTLFYTEINSDLKVGDKVFIINGYYDSDLLIQKNKYKKNHDGYKVLFIDKCKVVLDIDYTGDLPYSTYTDDDVIKIYYIRTLSEFKQANRAITTRSGSYDYKFNYYQNNIAYIDTPSYIGATATPGFFVKDITSGNWTNITTDFIIGSYSHALSLTYSNINRIKIMNGDFTYSETDFRKGFIYKYDINKWKTDVNYFKPYITKNNFRGGNFNGKWNSGLYGQYSTKIKWNGINSTWNIGTLINTDWENGKINSLYTSTQSYFSGFNEDGFPYQKINSPNNSGRGYNIISNSVISNSEIVNGSFYTTSFGKKGSTYSIVEDDIIGNTSSYENIINTSFFNDCEFNNSYLIGSELKNTKSNNCKFEKVKSINSYFKNSVLKNSNYNSDNIIKILAYDEFIAANGNSGVEQKVYKFYIDKNSYDRLGIGDTFYLKGIKINDNSKNVINFFDKKFKIDSWTEYTDIQVMTKTGYEYTVFLSTPLDNSYKYTCVSSNIVSGPFYTKTCGVNPNKYYSIDIWVSRYDIELTTTEILDFNTESKVSDENSPVIYNLGNIIDISNAYIVDSDFESGLIQYSDWNSGSHIENNNDNNITSPTLDGGTYSLYIDSDANLVATTAYNENYSEENLINVGDIVFLDSVDFGTMSRLPDAYKVKENTNGVYKLQEIGTYSILLGLSASTDIYSTNNAQNRYGHLKRLKIDKSNIKSGLFRRSYLNGCLIQNIDYNYLDKDFDNLEKIRNLIISDSIFSNNNNILSAATYINSFFLKGTDTWNCGIIQNSIWNGGLFNNGVIRDSRWVDGTFLNGWFYNSKTFNSISSNNNPYYYSENINSYYKNGIVSSTMSNNRNSWENGTFLNGEFYKSDWENGTFSNGKFYYSNFYDGTIENGIIGNNQISINDTIIYNGTVSYTTVENATLYAKDTSFNQSISQNINWVNGIFNNGVFGSDIMNTSMWYNGIFNGGQFTNYAKWKNGTFNNGKFTSGYGWSQSDSTSQSDYSWENGIFNGGEFGNANGLTNSTWYMGEFNDGIFKGRTWNDGIFLYGEFQGSGTSSVGGATCANANTFVDSYSSGSYWGEWRNGIFTNIKDKFISDIKTYTPMVKSSILEKNYINKKKAKFKNALWENGTFSHPSGEMISSVWLNGTFENGTFVDSSFNPYTIKKGTNGWTSNKSFNLDDTCLWKNGILNNSDFYISRWENGNFILGTATGMIWENGTANYMNAYNIFWENGIWKNGNWYGSSFEFNGEITDDYTMQILQRGMSWSGTSSAHVWNIFLDNMGNETNIMSVDAGTPSLDLISHF